MKEAFALINIEVRVGEFNFDQPIVRTFSTGDHIEREADHIAKYWFEDYNEDDDGGIKQIGGTRLDGFDSDCWFFFGSTDVRTKVNNYREISKEDYDVLKKYI